MWMSSSCPSKILYERDKELLSELKWIMDREFTQDCILFDEFFKCALDGTLETHWLP